MEVVRMTCEDEREKTKTRGTLRVKTVRREGRVGRGGGEGGERRV